MAKVSVLRHVAFEDLGLLEPLMQARGHAVQYLAPWEGLAAGLDDADLVVLLGGPISANDTEAYPFLAAELALAERRLTADRPLLGICLGAQIIARAVGGAVAPGSAPEIGWGSLELTPAGRQSPVAALAGVPVLHWHGEVCHVPDSIPSLARTSVCACQAFQPTARALALQFHAEVGAAGIEPWLVGHTLEIHQTPGVSVAGLRADTARYGSALASAGQAMFTAWLESVGL